MKEKSCAFTGYRPSRFPWRYDETDSRCAALKAVLSEQIAELSRAGYIHFLSGMAEGVDTWAALSVLGLRKENPALKLHCILPCKGQSEQWGASSRALYASVLEQADSVVYVSREARKNCMLDRNHFLVEHASVLLAVCANASERRSGTAATVRYAQKSGREIIRIDPLTLCVTREGTPPEKITGTAKKE